MKYRRVDVEFTPRVKELCAYLLAILISERAGGDEVKAAMLLDADTLQGNPAAHDAIREGVTMVGVLKADEYFDGFSDDELAGIIMDQLKEFGKRCPHCWGIH